MRARVGFIVLGIALVGLIVLVIRERPGLAPAARAKGELPGAEGTEPNPAPTDPFPLPYPLVDPEVELRKTERMLTVLSDGVPVKNYRMVLGREPVGDKEREGDGRTPEGEFYVCTKNPESEYHRSIGLSYPNLEDAQRGLAAGLINKREYRSISDAIHHLKQPQWNTALGGEIMIHGGGTRADWTAGCIALADKDAEELFNALPLGTRVVITP